MVGPGGRGGWVGRGAALLLGLLLLLVLGTSHAGAAGLGERVLDFTSNAEVEEDGSLLVHETIAYQFPEPRHGIIRSIVTRQRYDSSHERVFPLEVVSVQSSDGAPDQYEVVTNGAVSDIRIGDPSVEVDGQHTYDITYRLRGLLNDQPDAVELFWNATGNLSQVPTDRAQVTVHGPAGITDAACFQGRPAPATSAAATTSPATARCSRRTASVHARA